MTDSPQYYNELVADPHDRRPRLLDGHAHGGDRGRRQELVHGSACGRSTSTTTRCGSTRATPTTCWSAATAASTRAATAARTGSSRPTCRSPSSTASASTTTPPFYNVYGGTQDNTTPGRRRRARISGNGITNADWFITDRRRRLRDAGRSDRPEHRLRQSQYGGLVRYDYRTGETVDIQPQPGQERAAAALELGLAAAPQPALPHAALLRRQSPLPHRRPRQHLARRSARDLTRQIDRNQLEVMGTRLERRRGGQERNRPRSTATRLADRVAARRGPALRRDRRRARSRSPRTAARPGARSRRSRACRR